MFKNIQLTPKRILIALAALIVFGVLVSNLIDRNSSGRPGTAVPQSTTGTGTDNGLAVPATVGDTATSSAAPATPGATSTNASDNGDDGVDAAPQTSATTDPAAKEAVESFTAAWLNTYKVNPEQWRAGILPRVTADLTDDLSDADPATVPAGGRVGTVTMGLDSQLTVADVKVIAAAGPAATFGTLHLTVVNSNGTWLISEIDWAATK